jgi:hypothetical protein
VSDRYRRALIILLAIGAGIVFLTFAFLVSSPGITCEDAEDAAFDTVRCDPERGAGWRTLRSAIVLTTGAALLFGAVRALHRARFMPLIVPVAASIPAFVVGAIGRIELGEKPLPRVTEVRLLDNACTVPCAGGIRAVVTVDRPAEVELRLGPARFEDIGDRQYGSEVEGDPEVGAGTHELRVRGEIRNPPHERGPLPAGDYELVVTARPQDAGQQWPQSHPPVERRVTIRP